LLCSRRPQPHSPGGSSCTGQSGSCAPSRTQASQLQVWPLRNCSTLIVKRARFWGMGWSEEQASCLSLTALSLRRLESRS
jgi:hypothetical protein